MLRHLILVEMIIVPQTEQENINFSTIDFKAVI